MLHIIADCFYPRPKVWDFWANFFGENTQMKNSSILGWRWSRGWCAAATLVTAALGAQAVFAQAAVIGDAAQGHKKIAMCIGCHGIVGYQASFPEIHHVPKISGQAATYISKALHEYKAGERKHPTMHSIAASLSEQDMADIAAAYEASGQPAPAVPDQLTPAPGPDVAALLSKGACTSCHGPNLSKPIDPTYPKLAGQYSDYLYVALKAYQTEGNPQVGRGNAIMGAQAKQFTHAELRTLADYIGSLPGVLKTVPEDKFRH